MNISKHFIILILRAKVLSNLMFNFPFQPSKPVITQLESEHCLNVSKYENNKKNWYESTVFNALLNYL